MAPKGSFLGWTHRQAMSRRRPMSLSAVPRPPHASSPATSAVMRANVRADTSPELALRRALVHDGCLGYRLNVRGLPGSPDIVFGRARLAVFVHGCFWHRCPRHAKSLPHANRAYWRQKFDLNVSRDRRVRAALENLGWVVLTVWECEVRANAGGIAVQIGDLLATRRSSRSKRLSNRPQ